MKIAGEELRHSFISAKKAVDKKDKEIGWIGAVGNVFKVYETVE